MKYFILLLTLCVGVALQAQSWTDDLLAHFEFDNISSLISDASGNDSKLYVAGYWMDEDGPDPSIAGIGLDYGHNYMQVVPGTDASWQSTDALSASFWLMDFGQSFEPEVVFTVQAADGATLALSKSTTHFYLAYTNGDDIHFDSAPFTHNAYSWLAVHVTIDGTNQQAHLFVDEVELLGIDTETTEWENIQVYYKHNAYEATANNWFCYAAMFIHDRILTQGDFAGFADFSYATTVGTQEPFLHNSPINVYPTLLAAATPMQIQNPENTVFLGQLIDEQGRVVLTFNETQPSLNVTRLPAGSYRVRFQTDAGNVIRTVVRQ